MILNVIHSQPFFLACSVRLRSNCTERIFERLRKIDWTFCSYSSTVQYFCPVHKELTNQVEFQLFSVVFSSANVQSAALANPKRRLPAEVPSIHSTTRLPYKNVDGQGVHTWPVKFLTVSA